MMISPRLIRAAFTLLLLGTVAALLPSPDGTALAGNGCDTGPLGSTGQLAVAAASSNIRDTYALTPAAVTYNYYFKSDQNAAYMKLPAGSSVSTTFTVTSGQVVVNAVPYSAGDVFVLQSSTFMAAQKSIRNSFGVTTGYANGSMTTSSTYTETTNQSSTSGITYTATATFSAP